MTMPHMSQFNTSFGYLLEERGIVEIVIQWESRIVHMHLPETMIMDLS